MLSVVAATWKKFTCTPPLRKSTRRLSRNTQKLFVTKALKKSICISEEIIKELEKVERILKLDIEKLVREIISYIETIIKIQDTPTPESKLIDLLNSVSSNVKISKGDCYAEKISLIEAHIKDNVKILTQGRSEYESK